MCTSLIIVTASFSPPTSSQPPSLSSVAYFLSSRIATGRKPCIAFEKSSITKVGFTEFGEALEGRTNREAAACTALSTKISCNKIVYIQDEYSLPTKFIQKNICTLYHCEIFVMFAKETFFHPFLHVERICHNYNHKKFMRQKFIKVSISLPPV